jgi:hypothetical protein
MDKKDFIVKENVDREEAKTAAEEKAGKSDEGFTQVKNASASGLGTMGRNDQDSSEEKKREE